MYQELTTTICLDFFPHFFSRLGFLEASQELSDSDLHQLMTGPDRMCVRVCACAGMCVRE